MVDWEHTVTYHRPIYDAIFQRRPDDAQSGMMRHLTDTKEVLVRAVETPPSRTDLEHAIQPIRRGPRVANF
jgi:DNA-binding FadR family transcriptional regulator